MLRFFFSVVRHTSIRIVLSLVAHYDIELEQIDVKTAFLCSNLERDLQRFNKYGQEDLVCKCKRSLYGLKQSFRQWYKRYE